MNEDNGSLASTLCSILDSFEHDADGALTRLEALCHPRMRFQDPLQQLEGRDAFIEMLRKLQTRARELSFETFAATGDEERIYFSWKMSFRLGWTPPIQIDGATHVAIEGGLIVAYRDYWDLISSFIDTIPGAGLIYRRFASLLG
jgi:steroid delta-isomerase